MPDYGDSGGFQGSGGGQAATGGVGPQDTTNYGGYEDEAPTVDQPSTDPNVDVYGAQESYNNAMGITADNPYGRNGFFSRMFGINPNDISYANTMSASTRAKIANNQFSKFVNPQNTPGMVGYNPEFATAAPGKLRKGVQKAGYDTMFGKVMGQYAEQSTPDMMARGIMGLFGGPVGLAAAQLGTQEYGIPGLPGFESFDPNNPRGPQSIAGKVASALTGGIDPTQAAAKAASAANAISDYFSGKPSAPAQVQSVTKQAPVQGFEDAKSQFTPDVVTRPETTMQKYDPEAPQLLGVFSQGVGQFLGQPTLDNPVPSLNNIGLY